MKRRSGVYLYRCDKPGAIFGLPFIGRHNAYVGETGSFAHRHRQHTVGGGTYNSVAQPWADLNPKCYRLPTWGWKPWLRFVETVVILLSWPVYNDAKNRWNPRRITLNMAKAQRRARDSRSRSLRLLSSIGVRHVPALLMVSAGALYVWW